MFYMIVFFVSMGEPDIMLLETPFRYHTECIEAAHEFYDALPIDDLDAVYIACEKLPMEEASFFDMDYKVGLLPLDTHYLLGSEIEKERLNHYTFEDAYTGGI